MKIELEIDAEIMRELEYIVELHQAHGAPYPQESVQDLIGWILSSVADGSRRPGSWERQMLESMGIVAHGDDHQQYRAGYGRPEELTGCTDKGCTDCGGCDDTVS